MNDDDVLTGLGARANYSTDDNLVKRQSIFGFLDPETSRGGSPIERVRWQRHQLVADIGCGNGLWLAQAKRRVRCAVGLDLSFGMLTATKQSVGVDVPLIQTDAQALPIRSGALNGLLVMHMLYHVADITAALAEITRIMRSDGWALVTTNSGAPTRAAALYQQAVEKVAGRTFDYVLPPLSFDGENGAALLEPFFSEVEPAEHVAGFKVTYPDALLGPLESVIGPIEGTIGTALDWDAVAAVVRSAAEEEMRTSGAFRYQQTTFSFLCRP